MKTSLTALLFALFLTGTSLQANTTPAPQSGTYAVTSVDQKIVAGTPLLSVEFNLGAPQERVGKRYWIYHNYMPKKSDHRGNVDRASHYLVIEHDGHSVLGLTLRDAPGIAQLEARPTTTGTDAKELAQR